MSWQPDVLTVMKAKRLLLVLLIVVVVLLVAATATQRLGLVRNPVLSSPDEIHLIENPQTAAEKIVNGAKMEVLNGVHYDADYVRLSYPNGDVPADQGACTDVIVRALRNADFDLQKLIHDDMERNFSAYPANYGLSRPDSNIDHRRVPNQMAFLRRHGKELPTGVDGKDRATWEPGDIVYWKLTFGADHCGVISNDLNREGLPLVIHNLGGARQEDCLTQWRITGHFRYPIDR